MSCPVDTFPVECQTKNEEAELLLSAWNRKEIICACGLLPFFAWFVLTGSGVAIIVFLNGFIFHVFIPDSIAMKLFDTVCNTFLILWINILARDAFVTLLSCLAVVCFLLNSACGRQSVLKNSVHFIGVQIPLFFALYLAEREKPYLNFFPKS